MKIMMTLATLFFLLGSLTSCLAASGYFWVINDFHYDPTYNGTNVPRASCHEKSKDIPVAGKFGEYDCDAPWKLVEASINALKKFDDNPDFIIWNGDTGPHSYKSDLFDKDGKQVILDTLANCTDALKRAFPNTPIFPSIGNHDYYPKNQLPVGPDDRMYDQIYDWWKPWIGTEAETTFKKGAFYEKQLRPDLRFVVVNSNMWSVGDKVTRDLEDPADQFMWLDEVLTKAKAAGEKVYLVSHIPPGASVSKWWTETKIVAPEDGPFTFTQAFNNRFSDLIEKHADNIIGLFCSHHHQDYFHVYFKDGKPVNAALVVPSITPYPWAGEYRNPAVRRFSYDTTSYKLLDYEQYYFDLPLANKDGVADWKIEYSFKNAYGVPDVTKDSLAAVLQKLTDDPEELEKFVAYHSVMAIDFDCGDVCRREFLCSIGNIRGPAWAECMNKGKSIDPNGAEIHMVSMFLLAACLVGKILM